MEEMSLEIKTKKDHLNDEKKIMRGLGAKPQPFSGSGPIFKEDGESETFLYQLKSTEKESYTLHLKDVFVLFKNALVSRKIPVFVINFVGGPRLICFEEKDVKDVISYLDK